MFHAVPRVYKIAKNKIVPRQVKNKSPNRKCVIYLILGAVGSLRNSPLGTVITLVSGLSVPAGTITGNRGAN